MQHYNVIGIIQFCISSRWSELTVSENTRAEDAGAAKRAVLRRHERIARETDPHALVRWHSPELVSARPIGGENTAHDASIIAIEC